MEKWKGGNVEMLKGGKMERWKNGKVEMWKCGKVERWKNGKVEKVETWKGGKMEKWKDGKMEKWKGGGVFLFYLYVGMLTAKHLNDSRRRELKNKRIENVGGCVPSGEIGPGFPISETLKKEIIIPLKEEIHENLTNTGPKEIE